MVWKPIIEAQSKWYDVGEGDVKRKLRLFYNNVKGITGRAKSLGKKNRKKFSLEKMAFDFNKILDDIIKNIPQQVSLKLPKLKKVGSTKSNRLKLPKLKKQ